MIPRFTPLPSWTFRAAFIIALISLPLIIGSFLAWKENQHLNEVYGKIEQQVQQYQQATRVIQQQQLKQQKNQRTSPEVMKLFNPIGSALSPEVALLSLDADMKQHYARLEVVGKSLSSILDFSLRLQQIPARVELQNHRPSQEKNTQWPMAATLNVNFFDGGTP